jgi:capsular exopolysaccharide synthesis family protein
MGYFYEAMEKFDDSDECASNELDDEKAPMLSLTEADPTFDVNDWPSEDNPSQEEAADGSETISIAIMNDDESDEDQSEQNQSQSQEPKATAPKVPKGIDDRMRAWLQPSSVVAEEYRAIRTGLLAKWQQERHLIHTITSATPQEGKTITSLNLGLTFAELQNRRTIVIEADIRLPQFKKLLALKNKPGLVHLLTGKADLQDVIQRVPGTNLDIIPAGKRVSKEAVQLLSSRGMESLVTLLKDKYDHVIIDTPPVVELADAGILGAMSDDVLLIVRMGRTPKPLIEQAIRTLESYNAPVAGLIATNQQRKQQRYYNKYGYRYRYYHKYAEAA